jgi:hypothetical protein
MSVCGASLFGNTSQYIKINNGDFIAIQGSDTRERLITSDLRMPYKQILKSRVILKPGQINYLLNHLGLGDNATFLALRATYDPKSVIAEDNYISWSYYDDLTRINNFAQLLVLTGNSAKRIPQLYLTNPNTKYQVLIDVMVASIDDTYSIFTDTLNQSGTSFVGLEYTDIKSYVVGESIVFFDKSSPKRPLIYVDLTNIDAITKNGSILVIDDGTLGTLFFQFKTEYDANQANSLLNYVLVNPNVDIDSLSPLADDEVPVINFNSTSGIGGDYISFNGATSGVPYNTSVGFTFSTSISLSTFGTVSGPNTVIDKQKLIDLIIASASDNRDGIILVQPSNLILSGTSGVVNTIIQTGSYSLTFDIKDIAQNNMTGYILNLDIIS